MTPEEFANLFAANSGLLDSLNNAAASVVSQVETLNPFAQPVRNLRFVTQDLGPLHFEETPEARLIDLGAIPRLIENESARMSSMGNGVPIPVEFFGAPEEIVYSDLVAPLLISLAWQARDSVTGGMDAMFEGGNSAIINIGAEHAHDLVKTLPPRTIDP